MNFATYLQTTPAEIDRRLNAYLQHWAESTKIYSPLVQSLSQLFAEACRDGKRLRATLVKLGFDMFACGGASTPDTDIYPAALAYEIFQTAILAHDDIIDKSPLRRGKPTLYKTLQTVCEKTNDQSADVCRHYGLSQAICLGDMGLFLAMQLLVDSDFDPVLKNRALSFFVQCVLDTIAGQIIDVELPYMGNISNINQDDLLAICRYKTARYTITGPLSLGAILAGAPADILPAIAAYGDNLGIAFQLKDDLLGVFADETVIGKSVTSDIEEGKMTLLYFYALQHANPAQRAFLAQHYGTGPVTETTHARIKDIFIDSNAKTSTEKLMQEFADKAIAAIDTITINATYRSILTDLSAFMIKREK